MTETERQFKIFKEGHQKEVINNEHETTRIENIIYLIDFGLDKCYFSLDNSNYDDVLLKIFIDLCHNLVGIKGCIREGSPIGVKILMRRLLEIAININILFEKEDDVLRRLDIYSDFIKVRHHELFCLTPTTVTSEIIRKYEKEAKSKYDGGMEERKKEYRSDKNYMARHHPIFSSSKSIESLLRKYKLKKLSDLFAHMKEQQSIEEGEEKKVTMVDGILRPDIDDLDLYDLYSGNVHPNSTCIGGINKESQNRGTLFGYNDTVQFERDIRICGLLTYLAIKPILFYCSPEESSEYKRLFMLTMLKSLKDN